MKKFLLVISVMIFAFVPLADAFAQAKIIGDWDDRDEEVYNINAYNLSTDSRLNDATLNFQKALESLEKGDKAMRVRVGRAKKMYSNAKKYILKAQFIYTEEGQKYGIDVTHELATCERLHRRIHVDYNNAEKAQQRDGN
ncbi:MAG: hypothetical protein HQ594_01335 [Candidatus Omnitrophica bacterium]|nr:hypothetical protein [Candidatus Omnitrophota bacterium]